MVNQCEGLLYYQVVKEISKKHEMPESTVRWNVNKLRDAKLIVTGNIKQKGVPVELTPCGRMIASLFSNHNPRLKETEIKTVTDPNVTIEL